MKYDYTCDKCKSTDIIRIPGKSMSGRYHFIMANFFTKVPIDRFVCLNCGYIEDWIMDEKHLKKIAKKYKKGRDNYSDFV